MLRSFLALVIFLLAALPAGAQTPCQGGTATAPACARSVVATPLSVSACPATATSEAGTKLVLRELDGSPLLSVTPGSPGGTVTLQPASFPSTGAPVRTVKFSCEDVLGREGVATFASLTFRNAPVAPALQ